LLEVGWDSVPTGSDVGWDSVPTWSGRRPNLLADRVGSETQPTVARVGSETQPTDRVGSETQPTLVDRVGSETQPTLVASLALLVVLAGLAFGQSSVPAGEPPEVIREIFVPFEDLNVLLEGDVRRVFLTREQYDELLAKAKRTAPDSPAPHPALILSADYDAVIEDTRARLSGVLELEVLADGLQAIPLPFSGVGLYTARLDDGQAAIGRDDSGQAVLLVTGPGRFRLTLEMVTPLETSAAQQSLAFRVPTAPAARLRMTVPGNVEIKSGATVVRREVDEAADVTRFDLLLPREQTPLVMSLNNRLLRRQRVIVARSVLVDEITTACERLHATVSLSVLHGAADRFRFALPDGFEPTEVLCPLMARWELHDGEGRRELEVVLREPATETVVLHLSATRTPVELTDWTFPRLEPLDVAGQVAVVGLVVEQGLQVRSLAPQGMLPIDHGVLTAALPDTVFRVEPGAPNLRTVAAFYAPGPDYGLQADFARPEPRFQATTHLLLVMDQTGHRVHGGLVLAPEIERLFEASVQGPPGWYVSQVTDPDGNPLPMQRYEDAEGAPWVRVRLEPGVSPGETRTVLFQAVRVPPGWLGDWQEKTVEFPRFVIRDAGRDLGAIAIRTEDDLSVRPDQLQDLVPLDENEKAKYGLAGIVSNLAYRYDRQPYSATLAVRRESPTITARSYSFLQLTPAGMSVQYELVYDIRQARTRRLSFMLPAPTPSSLLLQGTDGIVVKEFHHEDTEAGRRWTAVLAEPASGPVRLAVRFRQPLASGDQTDYNLPLPVVEGVIYQTAVVAVEGHADLDLEPKTDARRVDIGELAAAQYRAGPRLLGVYEFPGEPGDMRVDIRRREGYGLPPAIVQRAQLQTLVATGGASITGARYLLRTKEPFLEVRLPDSRSQLWSARIDGRPIAPQTAGASLLISFPATGRDEIRDLQITYETPVAPLLLSGSIRTAAPRLYLRSEQDSPPREVPTADLQWQLFLPASHRLVRSFGSVETDELRPRPSPVWTVAAILYELGGGWGPGMAGVRARSAAARRVGSAPTGDITLSADASRLNWLAEGGYGAVGEEAFGLADAEFGDDVMPSDQLAPAPARPRRELAEFDRATTEAAPADSDDPFGPPPMAMPPVTHPAQPPTVALSPKPELSKEAVRASKITLWALEGVRSLRIDLEPDVQAVTFGSLGAEPWLGVTLVHQQQMRCLAWGVAGLVLAVGVGLTRATARRKATLVILVGLVALVLPPVTGWTFELGDACDAAFFAACLLVPYYLLVALFRWLAGRYGRCIGSVGCTALRSTASTGGVLLLVLFLGLTTGTALAQESRPAFDPEPLIDLLRPPGPIALPEDAVIIPYDPDRGEEGLRNATQVLVPYAKYVELRNRAYPDRRLEEKPPIVPYALAGAMYETTLAGDDFLELRGRLDIRVFTDQSVQIPLALRGAVLAGAWVDGQPARLQIVAPADATLAGDTPVDSEPQARQQAATRPAGPEPLVLLHVTGQSMKRLELTVRVKLARRGGWRIAVARVPTAPAARLSLVVPSARTEVRLAGLADRGDYETESDDARIDTAVPMKGELNLQWRPKVAEGQIDRSLTAESEAVLDVQEDGLRLAWRTQLLFPRSRRDHFTMRVPDGYLVERVDGDNVRGWEWNPEQTPPRLEIMLLKEAADSETVTVHVSQRGVVRADSPTLIPAPIVAVDGAMLHKGRLTVRRSPLLDLRTGQIEGLTRTDVAADVSAIAGSDSGEQSPLGLLTYQAYQFAATPFALQLTALPVPDQTVAEVQTLLRVAERETTVETRVLLQVGRRPVHRVRLSLPQDLELEHVGAGPWHWSETEDQGRRLLSVHLESGQTEPFSLVLSGTLGRRQAADPVAVPKFQVLDVASQQGDIVVQIDPAFDIRATDLKHCEPILLSRVFGWLEAAQRPLARLALRYSQPDYDARLEVSPRQPRVNGFTITNVKVTNIAVEETVIIDLTVLDAGIREVVFRIPAAMQQPRILAPLVRQKRIESAEDGWQRVRLELQEELLGQYRVLVENDRLLTMADSRQSELQYAPIPVLETGTTDQRYVTLEEAGRDELEITSRENLQPLSRQQGEWRRLAGVLGDGITQAFLVSGEDRTPRLAFRTVQHATVQTAGAGIGLAETFLIIDPSGAYRGRQTYHVYNTTQAFLEIQLPHAGSPRPAELWTATVAGEPVKPAPVPNAPAPGQVRVPLIKTAEGDRDYPVVLQYGGVLETVQPLRGVGFPFIKTLNINVELSQVRLRLPESFRWFYFGGTMRQVTDVGDLAAEFFDYNTRQVKRLMQVWDTENPYARARVAFNLKQLDTALHSSHPGSHRDLAGSKLALENYAANVDVLSRAQKETEHYFRQEAQVLETDNRARLNTFFAEQANTLARNVVTELDGNFKASVPPTSTPQSQEGAFRHDWLMRNQLDQRSIVSDEALQRRFQDQAPEKPASEKRVKQVRGRAAFQDGEQLEIGQRQTQEQQDAQGRIAGQPSAQVPEQTQRGLARQYQQQLAAPEESQQLAAVPGDAAGRYGQAAASGMYGMGYGMEGAESGRMGGERMLGMGGMGGMGGAGMGGIGGLAFGPSGDLAVVEGQFAAQTHLASLDVQLPDRGREYFFTTPRGDVQIMAYGINQSHTSRLAQLLAVAIGVSVLVLLYWFFLRLMPVLLSTTAGALVLVLLGLISLITMLLPILGLAALAIGTVQLVRLRLGTKTSRQQPTHRHMSA
jgi:hypothetical protein